MSQYAGAQDIRDKHVLLLGGAGYLGSILARRFLDLRYTVTVYDNFMFPSDSLNGLDKNDFLSIIKGDVRDYDKLSQIMPGKDIVVNLAAIVGDAACDLDPEATKQINVEATKDLYQMAADSGVERYIFASTCSVYGFGKEVLKEDSFLNPVSLYAQTKLTSELLLMTLSRKFQTALTLLRFGTLFGWSHRPRFDLVVNTMTSTAISDRLVTVYGGDQWRPQLHVRDAADSIVQVTEAPIQTIDGEIFNIGSNSLNMTILDLARKIVALIPGLSLHHQPEVIDPRDYLVDFSKQNMKLKFQPRYNIEDGVKEILRKFRDGQVADSHSPDYSNVRSMKETFNREGAYFPSFTAPYQVELQPDLITAISS